MRKNSKKNGAGKDKASPLALIPARCPASDADSVAVPRHAISADGTMLWEDATDWWTAQTELMDAENMSESLDCPQKPGSKLQPSVAVVANHCSTRSANESFGIEPTEDTVKSLAAILLGLLDMTYSGDKVALASYAARKMAIDFGVDPDEFERVRAAIVEKWLERGKRNIMMQALGVPGNPDIRPR
jgi:hypothetical protein